MQLWQGKLRRKIAFLNNFCGCLEFVWKSVMYISYIFNIQFTIYSPNIYNSCFIKWFFTTRILYYIFGINYIWLLFNHNYTQILLVLNHLFCQFFKRKNRNYDVDMVPHTCNVSISNLGQRMVSLRLTWVMVIKSWHKIYKWKQNDY